MDVFDSATKVALAVMVITVERDLHSTRYWPWLFHMFSLKNTSMYRCKLKYLAKL